MIQRRRGFQPNELLLGMLAGGAMVTSGTVYTFRGQFVAIPLIPMGVLLLFITIRAWRRQQ